jgi:ribosomal 50S subunit-associated protein YjgA (DUF615 family)
LLDAQLAMPPQEMLDQVNEILRALLADGDPAIKAIFEQYPAFDHRFCPTFRSLWRRTAASCSN